MRTVSSLPAILDCGDKSLTEISAASKDLVMRSQRGTLHAEEYTGGTFSISNMGMFDVTSFVAIIQPPQSAVLAIGTVQKRPVVQGDSVVVREIMSATLSVDHRVSDGGRGRAVHRAAEGVSRTPASAVGVGQASGLSRRISAFWDFGVTRQRVCHSECSEESQALCCRVMALVNPQGLRCKQGF